MKSAYVPLQFLERFHQSVVKDHPVKNVQNMIMEVCKKGESIFFHKVQTNDDKILTHLSGSIEEFWLYSSENVFKFE